MVRPPKSVAKSILKRVPGLGAIDRWICRLYTGWPRREMYRRGNFYSPLPDLDEVERSSASIFRADLEPGPDLDLCEGAQEELLREFAAFYDDFPWKDESSEGSRFHYRQKYFKFGDALILYSMMRHFEPDRILEVGSGFSSALMLDVRALFLDRKTELTFIEPYPDRLEQLLRGEDRATVKLLYEPVQRVPLETFGALQSGDILFVDSSHVSKVGSDVNFLFFEVLPNLEPGVIIHFHDIFWPFEYPRPWILDGRSWNEAYLLRAFLQYNGEFEILFFNSFAFRRFRAFIETRMPIFLENPGGSFWMRKK